MFTRGAVMRKSLRLFTTQALLLCCGAGLCWVTAGCAPRDLPPLVVSVEQQEAWVRNFNPLLPLYVSRWPAAGGIYEPLMIYNPVSNEYEPWLATGYAWDETDHVVVFSLRDDVRWSDGEPLQVDDVVFSFALLRRHPEVEGNGVWDFLREVRALDEHRVAFVFDYTFVPGLEFLAHQPILPEHIWRDVNAPATFANEHPVGTGPFTEVLHFDEQVYELGPNPYYWQEGTPQVGRLRMPLYRNNEEVIESLLAGGIDWSGNFIPDVEQLYVAKDPEHRGSWSPLMSGPVYLFANTTRPPFDLAEVRKALSMAIDRRRIADEALHGVTRPADGSGLSDAHRRFHDPEVAERATWIHYAPDAAASMLDEAGFALDQDGVRRGADGVPLSFEIIACSGWHDWVQATQIITENLAAVGIDLTIELLAQDQWFDRLQYGSFDLSLGFTVEGQTPYGLYWRLMSPRSVHPIGEPAAQSWHRFGDDGAQALLEAIEMTREEEIQQELFRQLQARFIELAPALPIVLAPSWGTYSSTRYVGFPDARNPYALLSPNHTPQCLLVMTRLRPRR